MDQGVGVQFPQKLQRLFEFILNVLVRDELDACRIKISEVRLQECRVIDLAHQTDEKDAGRIGLF